MNFEERKAFVPKASWDMELWSGALRHQEPLPLIGNYEAFLLFALPPVGQDEGLFGVDDQHAVPVLAGSLHLGIGRPIGAPPERHDRPAGWPPLEGGKKDRKSYE